MKHVKSVQQIKFLLKLHNLFFHFIQFEYIFLDLKANYLHRTIKEICII